MSSFLWFLVSLWFFMSVLSSNIVLPFPAWEAETLNNRTWTRTLRSSSSSKTTLKSSKTPEHTQHRGLAAYYWGSLAAARRDKPERSADTTEASWFLISRNGEKLLIFSQNYATIIHTSLSRCSRWSWRRRLVKDNQSGHDPTPPHLMPQLRSSRCSNFRNSSQGWWKSPK